MGSSSTSVAIPFVFLAVVMTTMYVLSRQPFSYRTAAFVAEDFTASSIVKYLAAPPRITEQNSSSTSVACSFATRRLLMERACTEDVSDSEEEAVPAIIVNTHSKVFFCNINKAGSLAAGKYFSGLTELPWKLNDYSKIADKPEFWDKEGYFLVKWIPFTQVFTRFKDYTKVMMVRHPLQRIVAAYLQLGKHKNVENWDNFTHFLERSVLNDSRVDDIHWMEYARHCHPCKMKYHYILKTETSEMDITKLNEKLRVDSESLMPRKHVTRSEGYKNASCDLPFKYDDILQNENPSLLKQIITKYSPDMKMFGYGWQDGRSVCANDVEQCC